MIRKITQATVLLVFAAACSALAQCMMIELPFNDRAQSAAAIFEGKVISQNSFWNSEHSNIYTSNLVEVYKVFKGSVSTVVEVVTPGGQVADKMEMVHPSLELNEGEVGTFFAQPADVNYSVSQVTLSDRYEPYAGPQGFVRYDLIDATAADPFETYSNIEKDVYSAIVKVTSVAYKTIRPFNISLPVTASKSMAPAITNFTPGSITAGTRSTLTINGSGFGATFTGSGSVQFKNADDGGGTWVSITPTSTSPPKANVLSWSDTQIQVLVPSKTGTGTVRVTDASGVVATSSSSLTMPYGQLTVNDNNTLLETRLTVSNQNTKGGLTFQFTPSMVANPSAQAAFDRALRTWRCATFVNFEISPTSASVTCNNQNDGVNIVGLDNASCQLSASLLGLTNTYYTACSKNGAWYWVLSGADIRFSANASGSSWNYGPGATTGNKYDFETTAMHELGHAHLMAHVILPGALMHWNRNQAVDVRTPSTNDLNDGLDVVARSIVSNACGPTVMIKLNSGNCLATAVEEISSAASEGVSVFPNPSFTQVSFNFSNFDVTKDQMGLIIYDPIGKEILNFNKITTPVLTLENSLPAGIYFYNILKNGRRTDSGSWSLPNNS